MDVIKLQHLPDDTYVTDPFITRDEWLSVLLAAEKEGKASQIETLLRFFRMPLHKGTCTAVAKQYGTNNESERSFITNFGRFTRKALGDRFRVESSDSEEDTYWPIPMLGKNLGKKGFEWTVRPELVDALRRYLLDQLLKEYRGPILKEGLDSTRSDERYKWQQLSSLSGKPIEEIVRFLASKDCNFVDRRYAGATLFSLVESSLDAVLDVFGKLLQEKPLNIRLKEFSAAAKAITPAGKTSFGDERTAAAFLAFSDPQQYTPYTSTIYETYCKYLGIPSKYARQKYEHFLELLQDLIPIEKEDEELIAALHKETDPYFWSEMLNAQDVLWQMQFYMKEASQKNWLQKIYDRLVASEDGKYLSLFPRFKDSVNLFLGMFEEGKTAADISEDTKDFFLRVPDNYISANPQGMYSKDEYEKLLAVWPDIYDTLKRNVDAGAIDKDDYDQLYLRLEPLTSKNKRAAYHRIWAGVFPDYLTSVISDARFDQLYDMVREQDDSLSEKKGNWLEDNLTLMAFFKEKVSFKEPWHRAVFGWHLYEYFTKTTSEINSTMNLNEYTALLEANMNLVLTGAPGTGKTYLAREIAKKMGDDKPGFVQFHPSYDYTDFVEGLRPDKGGGFVRRDGIFKDFCKKAVDPIKTALESFKAAVKAAGTMSIPYVSSPGTFTITAGPTSFPVTTKSPKDNPQSATYDDVREVIKTGKKIGQKTYSFCIAKYIREHYLKRNFVFIIDEINRGELSKIFGELFFAIDPGHRGERVDTQYQNMIDDPNDPFKDGFYVPNNVYIIGTMNDIDRGVESMDFAIRRRFAWSEVKAEDRVSMLDEVIGGWSDEAKQRMMSLNKALTDKKIGLTEAYFIGPAYFLKVKRYKGDFEQLWKYHIRGVLAEYLRGTRDIDAKLDFLKEQYDKYESEEEA